MFLVNMKEGRILMTTRLREAITTRKYRKWLDERIHLKDIPYNDCPIFLNEESLETRKHTSATHRKISIPSFYRYSKEPIGSWEAIRLLPFYRNVLN
jgi:glutamate synthase (ferredoxin)